MQKASRLNLLINLSVDKNCLLKFELLALGQLQDEHKLFISNIGKTKNH